MTLYKLYLGGKQGSELIPPEKIEAFFSEIVDRRLPGYSRHHQLGVWHGCSEPAIVVEYVGNQSEHAVIRGIGEEYGRRFGQDAVLMQGHPVQTELITVAQEVAA